MPDDTDTDADDGDGDRRPAAPGAATEPATRDGAGEPTQDGLAAGPRDAGGGPDVSAGEPFVCRRCGRRFARRQWRTLHAGQAHAESLAPAERAAFREAYRTEEAAVRRYRLVALGALAVLYFGMLLAYAVVAG